MAARFRDPDAPAAPTPGEEGTVRGRRGYETYGAIRTKPGRADAPPSICLSCSDKIAAWNVLGLQGAISPFAPVYLDYIVVGGFVTRVGVVGGGWEEEVVGEVRRALYGRLESIKGTSATYLLEMLS
jgi:tRNA-specific adenosine deaminase 1